MASKHSISRRSFLKAVGAGSAAVAAAGVLTACGGSSSSTASSAASAAPATTELAAEQVLNLIYTDLALIDVNDVRNSNEFEVLTAVPMRTVWMWSRTRAARATMSPTTA